MSVLGTQVGGNHYQSSGIQPIEYIEANDLNFHEGSAIKYITRWRNKNGLEDLQKAKWYIERLIELEMKKRFAYQESVKGTGDIYEKAVAKKDIPKDTMVFADSDGKMQPFHKEAMDAMDEKPTKLADMGKKLGIEKSKKYTPVEKEVCGCGDCGECGYEENSKAVDPDEMESMSSITKDMKVSSKKKSTQTMERERLMNSHDKSTHDYKPHPKYSWWCEICGYGRSTFVHRQPK